MKKKIIILAAALILLTGCSTTYDLYLDENSITEKTYIYDNTKLLEELEYYDMDKGNEISIDLYANEVAAFEKDFKYEKEEIKTNNGNDFGYRYNNTYKFLSKACIETYAKNLFKQTKSNSLSQAALETLAIIAYKQPITRVEIEEIRGVQADMMLRKLQAFGLIKEAGRSEAAGRPILYEVTDEFLDSFKLLSLDELPELPDFSKEDENEELFD